MKNSLVELTQDEIETVAGAGLVADLVGNLGTRFGFGSKAQESVTKASERAQEALTKVGLPGISNLIKFIV